MASIGITEGISRELEALHAARFKSTQSPVAPAQRDVNPGTARLIAALRMVLPLVDSDGQAWQSEEIRAAIAEFEHVIVQASAELSLELEPLPLNYRGFVRRLPPVTAEEMEEASRLFVLSAQQRREGVAS